MLRTVWALSKKSDALWGFVGVLGGSAISAIYVLWDILWEEDQQGVSIGVKIEQFLNQWAEMIPAAPGIVGGAVGIFLSLFLVRRFERQEALKVGLRGKQNHHLCVLDKFEPQGFWHRFSKITTRVDGQKNIYSASIELLRRAHDLNKGSNKKVYVKALVCSPAWDYPDRNLRLDSGEDYWGSEFINALQNLANISTCKVSVYHLPEVTAAGFKPLDDFISVLSKYIEENVHKNGAELLNKFTAAIDRAAQIDQVHDGKVQPKTIKCAEKTGTGTEAHYYTIHEGISAAHKVSLHRLASGQGALAEIREVHSSIPFQVVLTTDEKGVGEVVVSFAGPVLLEAGVTDVTGFHSSDTEVVAAMNQVVEQFVSRNRRAPYTPEHTRKIINSPENRPPHKLVDWFGFGFDVDVLENVFSPYFSNSSKFTADVVQEWVGKNRVDRILDIGSGTGVLGLTALTTALAKDPEFRHSKVTAVLVENNPEALEALSSNISNCTECNSELAEVVLVDGELVGKTSRGNVGSGAKMLTKDEIKTLHQRGIEYQEKAEYVDPSQGFITLSDEEDIVDGDILCKSINKHQCNLSLHENFGEFDLVIADLPYVDAIPLTYFDRAYLDLGHREQEALLHYVAESESLLSENGVLITSFSTLGGLNDVIIFENMIRKAGLHLLKKVDYLEDGYKWMVYILAKNEKTDWKEMLGVKLDNANPVSDKA